MFIKDKVGVGIITYNAENYFEELYNTIPFNKIDNIIVVNGGEEYSKKYDRVYWHQHKENYGSAKSRNDCIEFLKEKDCDYYFLIEDDLLIKNSDIFDFHIFLNKKTGLEYLGFPSYSWNSGHVGQRTPRLKIKYDDNIGMWLFYNSCNEYSMRTKNVIQQTKLYDEKYLSAFDIDNLHEMTQKGFFDFWYFPASDKIDDYVMNNPNAKSRMDNEHNRQQKLKDDFHYFKQKWGLNIQEIPNVDEKTAISHLTEIKNQLSI